MRDLRSVLATAVWIGSGIYLSLLRQPLPVQLAVAFAAAVVLSVIQPRRKETFSRALSLPAVLGIMLCVASIPALVGGILYGASAPESGLRAVAAVFLWISLVTLLYGVFQLILSRTLKGP